MEISYQRFAFKNFKCANSPKFKSIYKKQINLTSRFNRFKFNKSNINRLKLNRLKINNERPHASNLYKKTYNTTPKNKDVEQKNQIRKRAVKSSINYLLKKNNKLKLTTINTAYCMFYCRFGKCAKIDTCKFKHDKDKVAVCKNFLKGKCEVVNCLLSHKIDPIKMNVCSFFLKGICNIDNCPYRHVNVNINAEICKDFLKGFCSKGDQCKLLHQYVQIKCSKCKNNQAKKCECMKKSIIEAIDSRKKDLNDNQISDSEMEDFDQLIDSQNEDDSPLDLVPVDSLSNSNSNMEISDDDIYHDDNCLDFIPLVKDLDDVDELDDRRSKTPPNKSVDKLSTSGCHHSKVDYDSDDTWFEDEINCKNEFFQYIPEFLLK